jgi:hypothetical protein
MSSARDGRSAAQRDSPTRQSDRGHKPNALAQAAKSDNREVETAFSLMSDPRQRTKNRFDAFNIQKY